MTQTTIRTAYAKHKHGFTAYSVELTPDRYGRLIRSGFHIASDDTLEAALAEIESRIRYDWQSRGLSVPPIEHCGKVARIVGENHCF